MARSALSSQKTAILAVLSSIVIALEVFPIVGITDLPFYPYGIPFTIDWTGIPLIIILLLLGLLPAVFSTIIMFVAIGYRNLMGATFKFAAELFTIIGVYVAHVLTKNRTEKSHLKLLAYLIFGASFRAAGMFFTNLGLLPLFLPSRFPTFDVVLFASTALIPWNILQAIINILGGYLVFHAVPQTLRDQVTGERGQFELLD